MCKQGDMVPVRLARGLCDVDRCIAPMVQALNDAGLETRASCCGHGKMPGNVMLADGRELVIMPDYDSTRKLWDDHDWRLWSGGHSCANPLLDDLASEAIEAACAIGL